MSFETDTDEFPDGPVETICETFRMQAASMMEEGYDLLHIATALNQMGAELLWQRYEDEDNPGL